ncbi:hypothetical protein BC628DRAFT_1414741 [Trametes gibbosa]|nr:hypothetical protein BC628DRAFT_1414741 [Trametes gibbosa]
MSAPRAPSSPSSAAAAPSLPTAPHLQDVPASPATMFGRAATTERTPSSRNPAQTILIFSAIVAPLAIVPYALVRRRLAGLQTQLAHAHAANEELAKELGRVRWSVESGLEDVRRQVHTTLEREGHNLAKALVHAERAALRRDEVRRAWEGEMRKGVDALLSERVAERTRRADELKGIGQSLADAAAFMEEVEVRQGWTPRPHDGRGIERTRRVARGLQDTAASMEDIPQKETPADT